MMGQFYFLANYVYTCNLYAQTVIFFSVDLLLQSIWTMPDTSNQNVGAYAY